jgi:hypothetical protein
MKFNRSKLHFRQTSEKSKKSSPGMYKMDVEMRNLGDS